MRTALVDHALQRVGSRGLEVGDGGRSRAKTHTSQVVEVLQEYRVELLSHDLTHFIHFQMASTNRLKKPSWNVQEGKATYGEEARAEAVELLDELTAESRTHGGIAVSADRCIEEEDECISRVEPGDDPFFGWGYHHAR